MMLSPVISAFHGSNSPHPRSTKRQTTNESLCSLCGSHSSASRSRSCPSCNIAARPPRRFRGSNGMRLGHASRPGSLLFAPRDEQLRGSLDAPPPPQPAISGARLRIRHSVRLVRKAVVVPHRGQRLRTAAPETLSERIFISCWLYTLRLFKPIFPLAIKHIFRRARARRQVIPARSARPPPRPPGWARSRGSGGWTA
jgi:hypothetical protein